MNRPKTFLNEISTDPKAIKDARSQPIPQEQVDRSMNFLRSLALDMPIQTGGKIDTETRKVVENRTIEDVLEAQLEAEVRKLEAPDDAQDSVTLDVPLMIRLFELMREGVKSDVELHEIVERILSLKGNGVLTMDNYKDIAGPNKSGQMPEPEEEKHHIKLPGKHMTAHEELTSLRALAGIK
jgi:hypothetical protein